VRSPRALPRGVPSGRRSEKDSTFSTRLTRRRTRFADCPQNAIGQRLPPPRELLRIAPFAWPPRPHTQGLIPSMHRLPGLDLLRAIAIVWVMLFHSYFVGGLGDGWSWLGDNGWAGVDLFFVLSGYLIGSQWLKPLAEGRPPAFG